LTAGRAVPCALGTTGRRSTPCQRQVARLDARRHRSEHSSMSVTLEFDEALAGGPAVGSRERERHMQIELACRYYASGWVSFAQAARLAGLDHYAFGVQLGERGIPGSTG